MLQVNFIRENKKTVLEGLSKRNFANAENIIEKVLTADENRRATQVLLDNTLAESNVISREIGQFFKSGEVQKANILKEIYFFERANQRTFRKINCLCR